MVQDEFRAVSKEITQEERAERSAVKGQFTKYIGKSLDWHAGDYIDAITRKPKKFKFVSLDAMPSAEKDMLYVDSIQELQTVISIEQELQKLSDKEKKMLRWLLEMDCDEIALRLGCSTSNIYKKRKVLSIKLESLKEW